MPLQPLDRDHVGREPRHNPFRQDLSDALRWSWIILTIASVLILASPFVIGSEVIAGVLGVCPAKQAGHPCSLCGMTTAFYFIANGQFGEAQLSNAASVPLYFGLLGNALVGTSRFFFRSFFRSFFRFLLSVFRL